MVFHECGHGEMRTAMAIKIIDFMNLVFRCFPLFVWKSAMERRFVDDCFADQILMPEKKGICNNSTTAIAEDERGRPVANMFKQFSGIVGVAF